MAKIHALHGTAAIYATPDAAGCFSSEDYLYDKCNLRVLKQVEIVT
ncbi:MAG: hypothetical protein PUH88_07200 [Lachnospiraceae bacterium]|nr:hypothetical protein [Lachnospiraceae bacterium]